MGAEAGKAYGEWLTGPFVEEIDANRTARQAERNIRGTLLQWLQDADTRTASPAR